MDTSSLPIDTTSVKPNRSRPAYALSYHNSCLYERDIALLDRPFWLNDTLIGFWLELLENDTYARHRDRVLYVGPGTVQLIKLDSSGQMAGEVLEQLEARSKDFVFFPLNDNEDAFSPGGSHWSLLIFSRPDRRFYGLDSAGLGMSYKLMNRFARRVSKAVLNDYELLADCDVEMVDCKHQLNGYDCGVHVLWNTAWLTQYAMQKGCLAGLVKFPRQEVGRNDRVEQLRDEMMVKIRSMIKENELKA